MFGISFAELAIIFLLVLIVMGPEKLPEVARWAGKGLRELRKASNTVRNALEAEQFDNPTPSSRRIKSASPGASSPTSNGASSSTSADSSAAADAEPDTASGGLDQIDGDRFDEMLERQYQLGADERGTDAVDIADAEQTDDTATVELPRPNPDAGAALFDVALPATVSAEAA